MIQPVFRISNVTQLGQLDCYPDELLAREVPLFAAEGSFAWREGGEVTKAFLENLPEEWRGDHLVVDSQLVWMQTGRRLPTQWFHHEAFPGNNERAFGQANDERDAEHIACAWGAPSERVFVVGDISGLAAANADGFHPIEGELYPQRHQLLQGAIDSGGLQVVTIGMGTIHRYGWGSFQRTLETPIPGFHFHIRVTRGSERPVVNGRRNVVSPSFTGPWSAAVLP